MERRNDNNDAISSDDMASSGDEVCETLNVSCLGLGSELAELGECSNESQNTPDDTRDHTGDDTQSLLAIEEVNDEPSNDQQQNAHFDGHDANEADGNADLPDVLVGGAVEEEEVAIPKPRKMRPRLGLETFTAPKDALKEQQVTEERQQEDGGKSDLIWDFFVNTLSKFPTLEEKLNEEKENRLSKCASGNQFGSGGMLGSVDTAFADLTEAEKRKVQAGHLDALLKTFRRWSQEVHPAGWSLLEFARRMDVLTQSSAFQSHRVDLIKKYKTTDWQNGAAASPGVAKSGQGATDDFPDDLFGDPPPEEDDLWEDQQRGSYLRDGGGRQNIDELPALTDSQKEMIRQRREECLERRRRNQGTALLTEQQPTSKSTDVPPPGTSSPVEVLSDAQRQQIAEARQRAVDRKRKRLAEMNTV